MTSDLKLVLQVGLVNLVSELLVPVYFQNQLLTILNFLCVANRLPGVEFLQYFCEVTASVIDDAVATKVHLDFMYWELIF